MTYWGLSFLMHVDDDVACLHVERNKLVEASYLDIEDYETIIFFEINNDFKSGISYLLAVCTIIKCWLSCMRTISVVLQVLSDLLITCQHSHLGWRSDCITENPTSLQEDKSAFRKSWWCNGGAQWYV